MKPHKPTEREEWHAEHMRLLKEALMRFDAKHLCRIDGPGTHDGKGTLDFYSIDGKALIVQEYANMAGFEVFVPIVDSAYVKDVLAKIELYAHPARTPAI